MALVCGVDYLFSDYRTSMNKIYDSLSENGYLYIERNVFVDSEAYAGFPINSYRDLFGQNALMTTWFSVDQYRIYLLQYYEVLFERSFVHDETDGHKCIIYGFLCQKKKKCDNVKMSFYENNIKSLERLVSTNTKKQTSKSLISRLSNFKKHK